MDFITSLPIADFGPSALLALVIILIIRGDLIPRKYHEEVRKDRDTLQKTNAILVETNRVLASNTSLSVHALQSIEKEARETVYNTDENEGRT